MKMTAKEIIDLLGGVTSVARMLGIKPPSVHAWIECGIPDGRLRELAGQIEIASLGRFSRREQWPDKYAFYWPELAAPQSQQAPPAIKTDSPAPLRPDVIRPVLRGPVARPTPQEA